MRKIVMLNQISLDGYFAGPNGEMDWFVHEPGVDKASHQMMSPDTLLLGRLTYQTFESYWPTVGKDPNAPPDAKKLADELDQMNKVVFSKTLKEVSWVNTRLVKEDVVGAVKALKQGKGADITIFGSGTIVQLLADHGLIDEYLIQLSPVIIGNGKSLFKDVHKSSLALVETKHFDSGSVLLHYKQAVKK